jgi:hypothetical protein
MSLSDALKQLLPDVRAITLVDVPNELKEQHFLPVAHTYMVMDAWTPSKQKTVLEKLNTLLIQNLVSSIEGLPTPVSKCCLRPEYNDRFLRTVNTALSELPETGQSKAAWKIMERRQPSKWAWPFRIALTAVVRASELLHSARPNEDQKLLIDRNLETLSWLAVTTRAAIETKKSAVERANTFIAACDLWTRAATA